MGKPTRTQPTQRVKQRPQDEVGIAVLDRDLRYLEINDALAALNGHPAADHLGRTFAEMVCGYADAVEPLLRHVLRTGEPLVGVQVRGPTNAQASIPGSWVVSCYPVISRGGAIIAADVFVQPLPEVAVSLPQPLQIHDTAEVDPALFQTLTASLETAIMIGSRNGQVHYVNQAFTQLTGYTQEDFSNGVVRWTDLTPTEYQIVDVQAVSELMTTGRCEVYQKELHTKDGRRVPVEVSGRVLALIGTDNAFVAALFTDRSAQLAAHQRFAEQDRLFDLSLDLLAVADFRGYFHRINPAFSRTLGYDTDTLLQTPFLEFVHPDDRDATLQELERLRTGEPTLHFENRYRCQNGQYRWLAWTVYPVPAEDRLYCVARDVTQERETQQRERIALRQTDETLALLQTFLQQVPVGLAFVDRSLRFLHVSEVLAQINNMPAADHLGHAAHELFGVWGQQWEALWQRVLDTGEPIPEQQFDEIYGGQWRHARTSYFPVATTDGTMLGVGSLVSNVTDEVETARARQLAEAVSGALAGTLEYTNLAAVPQLVVPAFADCCTIMITRDRQTIEYAVTHHANPARQALVDLLLRDAQLLHGEHGIGGVLRSGTSEFLPTVDRDAILAHVKDPAQLQRALALAPHSLVTVPLTVRGVTVGAMQWILSDAAWQYGARELALAEELAVRISAAIEAVRLYHEAQEAVRTRDAFLAIAAHEFKNPLTTVLGHMQLMHRRRADGQPWSERDERALATMQQQMLRLNQMIADLLDLSRLESGQLQLDRAVLDLGGLVRQVVEELQPTTNDHTMHLNLAPTPVHVNGDPLRLSQVLNNLLTNAIKYSPQGGAVTVTVWAQDNTARLSIADQGIGIPAEALPRLFQRFYRVEQHAKHRDISGSGVGLFVVQEIINQHGGRVDVASEPGRGSTFIVILPLAQ